MKRHHVVFACIAGAGLVLAVWLLYGRSAQVEPQPLDDPAPIATIADKLPSREPKPEPSSEPIEAPVSHAADVAPEAEVATPALHQPDYGEALRRGTAVAEFELRDARGEPLRNAVVRASLHRKLGEFWYTEEAAYDPEQHVVFCNGPAGKGLEPGEYDLRIEAGAYGWSERKFRLAKHERLQSRIMLPNYRRVICFRFMDDDGNPVEWIDQPPVIEQRPERAPGRELARVPDSILRHPPMPRIPDIDDFDEEGPYGQRRARPPQSVHATDDGRWYVSVVAGCQARATFRFDPSVWGTNARIFNSRFIETDWDLHNVTLPLPADFLDRIKDHPRLGGNDPGRRSLIDPPPPLIIDDPRDVPAGQHRLIVELEAPEGVVPRFRLIDTETDEQRRLITLLNAETMKRRGNLWYADAANNRDFVVWFSDSNSFQTFYTRDERFKRGDGAVQTVQRSVSAERVHVPAWKFTPTVDAWVLQRRLTVMPFLKEGADTYGPDHYELDLSDGSILYGGMLAQRLANSDRCNVSWEVSGPGRKYFAGKWTKSWGSRWLMVQYKGGSELSSMELESSLRESRLAPDTSLAGLAFRAIGPQGEGLPWVEGSLVRLEDDALCERLREIESSLAERSLRPGVAVVDADYEAKLEVLAEDEASDLSDLDALPKAIREAAADRAARLWYARSGAWYDTWRRVYTDDYGFCFHSLSVCNPGDVYVLYLWSSSRDDLKPDARIVFRAEEFTDLGAIQLPAYDG